MRATITAGEVSVEVRVVRLGDHRLACAVAPSLAPLLGDRDSVEVEVVVVQDDGRSEELAAVAAVVRSGRAWTEARGRLRERRGWARRFVRSPAEVVVLTPRD
ncbi:hypothetical protein [Nocardioides plantarum]|uniref:Uncharacterized protein n=1 Tax=Nocardioides plantarum TaxID=29299 RepID=A0ABV5KBS3_9ACTN|nr:hypothetical protein [Nocardioides plantarum]